MNISRRRGAAVVLLVLLAVIVSACGGGADPGDTGGAAAPGGDAPAGHAPGKDGAGAAGDGAAADGSDDGAAGARDPVQVSAQAEAFCAAFADTDDGAAQREMWTEHRAAILEAVELALADRTGYDALDAVNEAIPCLLAEPRGPGPALIVIGLPEQHEFDVTAQQNMVAWHWQGGWRLELLQLPLDDPARVVLRVMSGDSGAELLMAQFLQGTGGYGAFELYRAADGLERLWESEMHTKFSPNILSDGRLFATYRAPEVESEPHYFQANCCMPVNGQTIYERDGDSYTVVATRLHPSVFYTASLFGGAINAGDYDLAASLVTDELLLQPLVGADGKFEPIELGDPPELSWQIDFHEAHHWDALGPDGGDLHDVTEVRWAVPSHNMTMVLQRVDDGWRIAGWE